MTALALTELLGAPVRDAAGQACGRVREVALAPQEDRVRISLLIVKTKGGDQRDRRLISTGAGLA